MGIDWETPGDETPGTLAQTGRRLRAQWGSIFGGMDDNMIALLVRLLHMPDVTTADEKAE